MTQKPLQNFQARVRFVLAATLFCTIVVIARLIDLQVSSFSIFKAAALENSDFVLSVPATRGVFLDRYGNPLVKNIVRYWQKQNTDALFSKEVAVDESTALAVLATDSAQVRREYTRWYPNHSTGAHVLGYVGPISKDELLLQPEAEITDLVGRIGLERAFNRTLAGKSGSIELEVTAVGKTTRVLKETPMIPGAVVQTTLDPYLMEVAQRAMGEVTGAVIIEDVQTGAILAAISAPTYDPNLFTQFTLTTEDKTLRHQRMQALLNDPRKVLFNRAVAGEYPPGSVFKLVTAIAGLESGSLTENTIVKDEGTLKVGDYSYANWYFSQYGRTEGDISLERAIARSNDIYFYKAAEFIGPNTLATWAKNLGLGSPTGIELHGEASGLVPDPEWKERTLHEQWFLGNTYHFGIGQGDVLVTPLQISQLFQTITNKGVRCQPHFTDQNQNTCYSLGIKDENLLPILKGLIAVCSTGGTAFPFFTHNQQFELGTDPNEAILAGAAACKTGTAEFGSADENGHRKTHGWFSVVAGMPKVADSLEAGGDDLVRTAWLQSVREKPLPKSIVITVLVESDDAKPFREGSGDAAPIALKIVEWMVGK